MKYVYILAGGALGSLIRFWVSEFVTSKYQSAFPTGIFFVNIVGALVIGFLFGLFTVNGQIEDRLRFLLFVGFLGGFTTFSSFALENMRLLKEGLVFTSLLYILLTNIVGIGLAFAGYFIGLKFK
ncbi:MAG: fluoride efflux transporter CrcB [Chitinophagales bacterium]|nr:fluoride efflux transporter CrcB [Chitinophagales bacterium]